MAAIGWRQILSIILLDIFALWLTYGYLVSSNPLTLHQTYLVSECSLSVDFPENLVYGLEITLPGKLYCRDHASKDLMVQAILICGDLSTLTLNTTRIGEDGTFTLKLIPSFPKPSAEKIECSLTVQVISKTVSTELMSKKTLSMLLVG